MRFARIAHYRFISLILTERSWNPISFYGFKVHKIRILIHIHYNRFSFWSESFEHKFNDKRSLFINTTDTEQESQEINIVLLMFGWSFL